MQSFFEKNDIKTKKRLISRYTAKDILLFNPLLQWYLQQGLVVTKIEQVLELVATEPLECFVIDITHHRQMTEKIPRCKIIVLNKKMTGNSVYGSLILDKQKYTRR
jgi:hypothetical protein